MQEDMSSQATPPADQPDSSFKRYARLMLVWAFAGMLAAPMGLYIWSELFSVYEQDLGFIQGLLQYTILGLLVGAAVGAALAASPRRIQAKARRIGIIAVVIAVVFIVLYSAATTL